MAAVLARIAEAASETLDLQEVFDRVANAVRELIPFDHMGVVRIVGGDRAVLHATTIPCDELGGKCSDPKPLTEWSPRLRPRAGPNSRIDDAEAELDPGFPIDAELLRAGVRSGLWEPFRWADSFQGGVWLCAYRPHAFRAEHQEALRPIAALLGSAVEHWRIWDTERRRRDRLDRIDELLGALTESLDVRQGFARLSEGMQSILSHDMMTLTELDIESRTARIVASAGECDIPVPTDTISLTQRELAYKSEFEIVRDIPAEVSDDSDRHRLIRSTGMRSWVRVPLLWSGKIQGGLSFFHRDAGRYDSEDAEVARRLADRISLTFSLKRLAEEARLASESRDRAERLEATVQTLTRELELRERRRIVGASAAWKETLKAVGRVASSETTVLITGESGTGKEVIARLVHEGSARAAKPFVAINCAALPEQLLESELFGYEKGAFTGAATTKIGRIEQAAGGTLFLDEIGEMSPLVQAKFLRVLEQREFQRLGGTRTLKTDVRIVAATNRDLGAAIEKQQFREDLFYRLNVFQVPIAPLRERPEDILPLAEMFLEELAPTMDRPAAGISREARDGLLAYPWPGNVRELRNAIERAILLCDGGLITTEHLPQSGARNGAPPSAGPTGNLVEVERNLVENALKQAGNNKSLAARLLGITRSQLYSRIARFRIE